MLAIEKASRNKRPLKLEIGGPPGCGKTFTALVLAMGLGGKTIVLDTENKSSNLYAGEYLVDLDKVIEFDFIDIQDYRPRLLEATIQQIEREGIYKNIIIDSYSHFWAGKDGVLDIHSQETVKSNTRNSYIAWRTVTPESDRLISSITKSPLNIIACVRSKVDYVIDQEDSAGKKIVRKVGTKFIQKPDSEYEFDIVGLMDADNNLEITKTRYFNLGNKIYFKPGAEFVGDIITEMAKGVDIDASKPSEDVIVRGYLRQIEKASTYSELEDIAALLKDNDFSQDSANKLRTSWSKRKTELPAPTDSGKSSAEPKEVMKKTPKDSSDKEDASRKSSKDSDKPEKSPQVSTEIKEAETLEKVSNPPKSVPPESAEIAKYRKAFRECLTLAELNALIPEIVGLSDGAKEVLRREFSEAEQNLRAGKIPTPLAAEETPQKTQTKTESVEEHFEDLFK